MKWLRLSAVSVLCLLALSSRPAQARVFVGVGIGLPVWGPPCYGWRPYYYRPYYYAPYYYAPPPVVVAQPAPVTVVQPAPVTVVQPSQPAATALQPVPVTQSTSASSPEPPLVRAASADSRQTAVSGWLQRLSHSDDAVRSEAAIELGRMKARRAVDPLAATLAGDRSPAVREAAARALGLIGSPQALTALQHAALADNDNNVRHIAQFAADVIQSNQRR
jgi:hypothetical protein